MKSQMSAKDLDAMINAKYLEYHKKIDLKKFGYVNLHNIAKYKFFFQELAAFNFTIDYL